MKIIAVMFVSFTACAFIPTSYNIMAGPIVKITHDGDLCAGVVYRRGRIVTNRHCVEGAVGPITVELRDGTQELATLIGKSDDTDVAVLGAAVTPTPAVIGDSDLLAEGDTVFVVGHPLGMAWTLTKGIVSYVNRTVAGQPGYFVQTDASINPGNSGGALYNEQRALVGINSGSMSVKGGSDGIGFAIPINDVMTAVRHLDR